MGEVISLFGELPNDLKAGDLVWLSRFASFGTIIAIRPTGRAEIAIRGGTIDLHVVRNRHEIHISSDDAFKQAAVSQG